VRDEKGEGIWETEDVPIQQSAMERISRKSEPAVRQESE